MRSLRSRLILGSSLIAVVPLVVGMVLLSQRIQSTVRSDASERLGAALDMLQVELRSDGERIAGRLAILARDPALKRLYLVRPAAGRDLPDFLAEKRFLLGLDFLEVVDARGGVVADGSTGAAPAPGPRAGGRSGPGAPGARIESVEGAPALAMTAEAPIRYQDEVVGTVRGGLLIDAAFLSRLKQASGIDLVLRGRDGRIVASTLAAAPARAGANGQAGVHGPPLSRTVALATGDGAGITGLVSTASAEQTIAALRLTSVLLGLLGLAIAIALGIAWSSQVSRPVEELASFSQRIAEGRWETPLTLHSVRELQTLVAAFERMREDLRGYRERLVTSERHAAWSQMARQVAHEVRNPLTPIAVSIADLRRSFEQQRPDFPQILDQAVRTVTEEVESLKRILEEFSDLGRFPPPVFAPCRLSDLLADLRALYGRDIVEGRLAIPDPGADVVFPADRGQVRQAMVNLIKNGLEAVNERGHVTVSAGSSGRSLDLTVSDDGPGLDPEQKARLFAPGFTTKPHGGGLGLTIVERIVSDHRGAITVEAEPGRGTTFLVRLPLERAA